MDCVRHEETLKSHEKRIGKLEIADAEIRVEIKNLIKNINSLTSWIKALVLLGGSTLVGFFIWYIQTIGR